MTEEDSQYLTEKMGLIWNTIENSWGNDYGPRNIDFASEHGFFVAWEFFNGFSVQDRIAFESYLWNMVGVRERFIIHGSIPSEFIGPRFAEELVAFLKGREK